MYRKKSVIGVTGCFKFMKRAWFLTGICNWHGDCFTVDDAQCGYREKLRRPGP